MDKNSLKKVIKPLIKECLKEVLVEEGLVKLIKEYNSTGQEKQVVKNAPESTDFIRKLKEESKKNQQVNQEKNKETLNEKLNATVATLGFNPFSGTQPAPDDGEVQDSGVNIDNLISKNQNSWSKRLG